MTYVTEIQVLLNSISDMEKLVARQVGRIFILRSAQRNCRQAETKLSELCAMLASHRARLTKALAALRSNRPDEKSLRAGSDVGGPRWHIGWAAVM